jgi:hypothetical protein
MLGMVKVTAIAEPFGRQAFSTIKESIPISNYMRKTLSFAIGNRAGPRPGIVEAPSAIVQPAREDHPQMAEARIA